jgi:hypothetical protein
MGIDSREMWMVLGGWCWTLALLTLILVRVVDSLIVSMSVISSVVDRVTTTLTDDIFPSVTWTNIGHPFTEIHTG